MKLPSGKIIDTSHAIISGGNFTWHEALWSNTAGYHQVPGSLVVEHNIVKAAQEMQKVRKLLGDRPIRVNSWYRNQQVNQLVGGEPNSVHMKGLAIDFVHPVLPPSQIAKILANHNGGLGIYSSFVHIDWRGYRARW